VTPSKAASIPTAPVCNGGAVVQDRSRIENVDGGVEGEPLHPLNATNSWGATKVAEPTNVFIDLTNFMYTRPQIACAAFSAIDFFRLLDSFSTGTRHFGEHRAAGFVDITSARC
jgi:hypothetical protein